MSYIKKSASTFATQIMLMIMGMATGVVVARMLGPEVKGKAALLTLLAQTLFMVCSMGMGSAFAYFIAKKKYPPRQIMSAALACSILFGTLGIMTYYCSWPLHASIWAGIPHPLLTMAGVLSLGYIYSTYLVRILVGHGQVYEMNLADIARAVVSFMATLLLVWIFPLGLTGIFAALFAAAITHILVLCWFLRADLHPTFIFSKGILREGITYGLKSHALLLINFLNYRIDLLLLKHFTDDTAVGIYSLAVGMAELMWLLPNATVAPLFADIAGSEEQSSYCRTLRTVRWSMLFLLVLALIGCVTGRWFIGFFYGLKFIPSYAPFIWLLPGVILFPIYKLLAVDLAARGAPGYGTIASGVALIVNIFFNIVLIPCMQASGAAVSSTISYSVMSIFCLFFYLKKTEVKIVDLLLFDDKDKKVIRAIFDKLKGPKLT